jgi:hypothetical protein
MKIAALMTAAALACGAAYANTTADAHKQSAATASTAQAEPQGEGLAVKTKRAFKRMGDKLRSIGHKDTQQAKGSDTSAMGAGPEDSGRRARMDSAYSNWQKKQQK